MRQVARQAKSGAAELEAGKGLQREKRLSTILSARPNQPGSGLCDGQAQTSAIWTTTLRPRLMSSAAGVEDLMP